MSNEDSRPAIQLPGNNRLLSDFAAELGNILSMENIFSRGGSVFTVNSDNTGLAMMDADRLRTWLEQYAVCFKILRTGFDGEPKQIRRTATASDAEGVLSSPQFLEQLQPIEKFNPIRMPVKDREGYLKLLSPGYDEFARTFTAQSDVVISDRMPLEMAINIIDELLGEFPFADGGRSKAVALAAMLTVFAQGILPRKSLRPCFIFLANAEGAGKTLLTKVATVPVLGFSPTGSKAKDEDEMRKLLLAAILEAKTVLCLDNIKGRLASESLEGFLTSQNWAGRVLGGSTTFTGENNVTVFITGNGCTVSPDMRRRSLFCELFIEVERAEDRIFKQPLEVPELIDRRGEILSALYSLILDWHKAMEPKPSRSNSSFPEWARIIGGIVENAGYVCPLETPEIEAAADVDGADIRSLVKVLGEGALERTFKFSEIVTAAQQDGLFERILPEDCEPDIKTRAVLSKLIGAYDGRLIAGFRLIVEGKGHKRVYRVKKEVA
jgi:hypothetical protein